MEPLVTIIVLNYDGKHFLKKCFTSLHDLSFPKKQYKILFVDNASQDGSVQFVRDTFPTLSILEHPHNYGFCQGNNLAIQQCTSKYVLLLNNDLHVHKDFLKNLVEVMESDARIGCCGGEEYGYTDNILIPRGVIRETSWMGAGATIYRKEALEQSGLFDPTFFFNCEDVDISWRLKLHNWKIFQNEKAIFYHAGKDKKITFSSKGLYYAWRNRIFLLIKFASITQIMKSSYLYARLLFGIRRGGKHSSDKDTSTKNHEPSNKKTQESRLIKFLSRFYFSFRIVWAVFLHFPEMSFKRYQLKRIITNQKEVDRWVSYVDNILRN